MTDSPVPPTFLPLTDLELAQITADLAPMGFLWQRWYGLNAWRNGSLLIAVNEGQAHCLIAQTPQRRFISAGSPAIGSWTGFDSHISAATWLLLQSDQMDEYTARRFLG